MEFRQRCLNARVVIEPHPGDSKLTTGATLPKSALNARLKQ